jgi:hypothetical protein
VSHVRPERFAPGEAILLDAARAMALPPHPASGGRPDPVQPPSPASS